MKDAQADYDQLAAEYAKRAKVVAEYEKTLPAKQAQWEKNLQGYDGLDRPGAARAFAVWPAPSWSSKRTIPSWPPARTPGRRPTPSRRDSSLTGITGIRLEALTDPSLPGQGPGRAPNGNFVLNEFRVTAAPLNDPSKGRSVVLHRAQADFSQASFDVKNAIDGNASTGWAIHPQVGKPHTAVFEAREPIAFPGGVQLTFTLDQQYVDKQHNLGKFRISVTTAKPPITLGGPPAVVAKVLSVEPEKRTDAQKAELANYFRSLDGELARLQREAANYALPSDKRLLGAQDLAWALMNSPGFLFNH